MTGYAFRANASFEWKGTIFRVREIAANGEALLEATATGVLSLVPVATLLKEYAEGRVRFALRAAQQAPVPGRPLDELDAGIRDEVKRRLHYLSAICHDGQPVFSEAYLRPLINRAASEFHDGNPPTISTLHRWLRRYQAAREDARALIPRFDRRGRRQPLQSERVLELLGEAVAEAYKASPRAATRSIHSRLVELAFLGLVSAWEEFLEQSFVRYLAGAKADDASSPTLRLGKATDISHSYHLISGDPSYDPAKNYSKFGDPKWVIAIAKNYMALGAPYATKLHPNVQVLQSAVKLRNRVAHNSEKSREDFKKTAREHLGLAEGAALTQGYSVGDLLLAPAERLFGAQARDRDWTFFTAYNARMRKLAREIAPPPPTA